MKHSILVSSFLLSVLSVLSPARATDTVAHPAWANHPAMSVSTWVLLHAFALGVPDSQLKSHALLGRIAGAEPNLPNRLALGEVDVRMSDTLKSRLAYVNSSGRGGVRQEIHTVDEELHGIHAAVEPGLMRDIRDYALMLAEQLQAGAITPQYFADEINLMDGVGLVSAQAGDLTQAMKRISSAAKAREFIFAHANHNLVDLGLEYASDPAKAHAGGVYMHLADRLQASNRPQDADSAHAAITEGLTRLHPDRWNIPVEPREQDLAILYRMLHADYIVPKFAAAARIYLEDNPPRPQYGHEIIDTLAGRYRRITGADAQTVAQVYAALESRQLYSVNKAAQAIRHGKVPDELLKRIILDGGPYRVNIDLIAAASEWLRFPQKNARNLSAARVAALDAGLPDAAALYAALITVLGDIDDAMAARAIRDGDIGDGGLLASIVRLADQKPDLFLPALVSAARQWPSGGSSRWSSSVRLTTLINAAEILGAPEVAAIYRELVSYGFTTVGEVATGISTAETSLADDIIRALERIDRTKCSLVNDLIVAASMGQRKWLRE